VITVYIVLGVLLRELHPPHHDYFPAPIAGVGAILAFADLPHGFQRYRAHRNDLLIGIVKKNAIMMIDFALEASARKGKRRWTPSTKPACCVFVPS